MEFLYPNVLYALAIPVVMVVLAWIILRRRSRRWEALVSPQYRNELVVNTSAMRRAFPLAFGTLGLIFLILAMARPYSGMTEVKGHTSGTSIILAIDCSRSMLATDTNPSRLERAKMAAYDLIDAHPDDNYGIIIFSGEAMELLPFTYDVAAVKEAIEQIDYEWIPTGGTNLEDVLAKAVDMCKRSRDPESTNALIIFSDGEDTVNLEYKTVKEAREDHLIVITVGIGTTSGGLIPDRNIPGSFYRDRTGNLVTTQLHAESLIELADKTGGKYMQLSSGQNVGELVKSISDQLSKKGVELEERSVPNDRYQVFAIPALICLLLALITGTKWRSFSRRASKYTAAIAAVAVLFSAGAQAQEETDRDTFARGYEELKQNKTKEASQSFSDALLSSNKDIQAEALYNLGNTIALRAIEELFPKQESNAEQAAQPAKTPEIKELEKAREHLVEAVEHYNDSLKIKPGSKHALANKQKLEQYIEDLKKAEEELKKQQEEQQKQDQQKQDQQQQQNQNDQQKQDQQQQQNQNDQQKQDQQQQNQNDQQKQDQQQQQNQNDQQKQDQQQQQNQNDQQKQDQQQQQNQNDQQKQDQQQQNQNDQQKQDQQQQNQNDQQKQDQQQQQNQNDQQKQDQQQQQNQNDQQKQDQQQQQNQNDQQKQDQQQQQNQNDQQKQDQQERQAQAAQDLQHAEIQETQEEKERREAARILREQSDIEKGAPFPIYRGYSVPEKDY